MGKLFIGTSGYNYMDWKNIFYPSGLPQKKWLQYYSEKFTTVEINATFYRSFPQHVYEQWYQSTKKDFTFTLKGPRTITHIKRLRDCEDELEIFINNAAVLNEKLTCIVWQFPANFRNDENKLLLLKTFMKQLPRNIRHAVEFRHNSWFVEDVYQALRKQAISFVINDSSKFPAQVVTTAGHVYIRFHGPRELYASAYTTRELMAWSLSITKWLQTKDVYAYFNNDFHGHAFRNARELASLIYHTHHANFTLRA